MGFEDQIGASLFKGNVEKSFVDKLLAKEDADTLRQLIKKPRLTRKDLLEILYLLSGNESKLVNYTEWDRYVVLKYFVWIREFVKVTEMMFDYWERLKKAKLPEELLKKAEANEGWVNPEDVESAEVSDNLSKEDKLTWIMLDNNQRLMEHNVKFLIDLYMNIARTSLSIGATGFLELLTSKFEMMYPQGIPGQVAPEEKRGGLLGRKR